MKSFKQLREYVRGFGTYPGDTMKPMSSLGGAQFFPNRRYATTMPAMSAAYKGAGHGTIKPMSSLSASQKFAVSYKGSKNVGKMQTPGGMANIAKPIDKTIKITAKDADSAKDIVRKVLDRRVRNDQLRRYDLGVAKAVNENK